jgi:hypothetical protein
MHPGSISLQHHVRGTPTCRCHHLTEPKKHGPHNKLTYVHRGKPFCRFVKTTHLEELKTWLAADKTFRTLMVKWIALSIERARTDFFPLSDKPRGKSPPKLSDPSTHRMQQETEQQPLRS